MIYCSRNTCLVPSKVIVNAQLAGNACAAPQGSAVSTALFVAITCKNQVRSCKAWQWTISKAKLHYLFLLQLYYKDKLLNNRHDVRINDGKSILRGHYSYETVKKGFDSHASTNYLGGVFKLRIGDKLSATGTMVYSFSSGASYFGTYLLKEFPWSCFLGQLKFHCTGRYSTQTSIDHSQFIVWDYYEQQTWLINWLNRINHIITLF